MKNSTHINPKAAVGQEIKGWLLMLLVVAGLGGAVQAQLAVVNGDFSDLTGLTGGPPWYGGAIPYGWSGFTANPYVVNNGVCNIAVLNGGDLSQAVGTTTKSGAVVLEVWAVPVKNPRIVIAYAPGTDPSNPHNLVTVQVRDNRTFMLKTRLKASPTDREKVYDLVGSIPKWRGQRIC